MKSANMYGQTLHFHFSSLVSHLTINQDSSNDANDAVKVQNKVKSVLI